MIFNWYNTKIISLLQTMQTISIPNNSATLLSCLYIYCGQSTCKMRELAQKKKKCNLRGKCIETHQANCSYCTLKQNWR